MQSEQNSFRNRAPGCRGFTIAELLVVIVILAVLSALGFAAFNQVKSKMLATQSIHRIRQCGIMVLQKASENNNFLMIHANGTSSNMHDLRLHGIVKEAMQGGEVDKLVYTPAYERHASGTWPVWGVNLDDHMGHGVDWEKVWVRRGREDRSLEGLRLAKCKYPARYPLLADSSNSSGIPRARFANDNKHKFAMRYQKKGPVFLLDGSCRLIGRSEMGNYGITRAYLFGDDPVAEPTLVRSIADPN